MECGMSQREICAHFNEGNLAQFRRSAENKELWSYPFDHRFIFTPMEPKPIVFFSILHKAPPLGKSLKTVFAYDIIIAK